MKKAVSLYDTTLRDGAQGEGISFSESGKLSLVRRLDAFGVCYVEGGYAGSNPRDMAFFHAVRREELRQIKVAAFGRTRKAGVRVQDDEIVRSLLDAGTPVVTIFGKSSWLHVNKVLRCTESENAAMIADTVAYLKSKGREVFFDAEHFFDGYKASPEFAMQALEAAAGAGADVLVLCDTNGGSLPHEVFGITTEVIKRFRLPVGIHAHNDMGMAVANSAEAVRAGAVQVQGTINGYGERCGNANLCTIMPAIQLKMGRSCVSKASLAKLRELSLFVDDLVNRRHDPAAPFIGQQAFSHKAGAHVHAVQKAPETYEHIDPGVVGNERHILVSELSGGSNVLLKAIEMGVGRIESAEGMRDVLGALKALEAKGYTFEAADASFQILVQKVLKQHRSFFDLEGYRVIVEKGRKGTVCTSEATIKLRVGDQVEQTVAEGDGPVNALDKALRKALGRFYPEISKVVLTDFRVRILDPEESTAAKTRVLIESSDGEETWGTVGVSENIIEASWEALVDSVEYKLFREEKKRRRGGRPGRRKVRG